MSKVQQPIRIKLPDSGVVVEHSDPNVALSAAQQLALVPPKNMNQPAPDAKPVIRARTWADDISTFKDKIGRLIAPALGIDYDAMANSGYNFGMVPLPLSAPSQSLIDAGIARETNPAFRAPRGKAINSLLVDEGGNMLDLGQNTHDEAMMHLDPESWKTTDMNAETPATAMGDSLAKNKMIRVQYGSPRDIAVEMHHAATPHQIDALANIFDANPQAKASYDFTHNGVNKFANGVTPSDLIDMIFQLYHTR